MTQNNILKLGIPYAKHTVSKYNTDFKNKVEKVLTKIITQPKKTWVKLIT
jgi:hypothetical protein